MFGFDEINWEDFIQVIIYALCVWYLGLFVFFWLKSRNQNQEQFFENYNTGESKPAYLQPIAVSSKDFPSEIMPIFSERKMPLETSFYEETGLDEGYRMEHFTEENNPKLSEILPEIQLSTIIILKSKNMKKIHSDCFFKKEHAVIAILLTSATRLWHKVQPVLTRQQQRSVLMLTRFPT